MDKITLTFTYKSWALQTDKKISSIPKMKKLVSDDIKYSLMNGYHVHGIDESCLTIMIPFFSSKSACNYREIKIKIDFDDKCKFKCTDCSFCSDASEFGIECEGRIKVTVTVKI